MIPEKLEWKWAGLAPHSLKGRQHSLLPKFRRGLECSFHPGASWCHLAWRGVGKEDKEKDKDMDREMGKEMDKEKEKDMDREMDKEKGKEKDREIGKDMDKEKGKEMDKEKDREMGKEMDKEKAKEGQLGCDRSAAGRLQALVGSVSRAGGAEVTLHPLPDVSHQYSCGCFQE